MQDEDQGADECVSSSNYYLSYTLEDLRAQVDQNDRGEHRLTVPELHYVIDDEVLRRVADGQGVETTGQFALDPAGDTRRLEMYHLVPAGTGTDEVRLTIRVEFPSDLPAFDPEAWYMVSGKMRYPDERGEIVAVLEADRVAKSHEPLLEEGD